MLIHIDLKLRDKLEWARVFDPRDCTLFIPTEEPPQVGETVRADVLVEEGGPRVIFRGHIISRRTKGAGPLVPGCVMTLGPEEREKVNYLNGYVRGGLLNLREKRRLPLRLPIIYGGLQGPCESVSRDINEEGVFILSETPLPEDTTIQVIIRFPGLSQISSLESEEIRLTGVVVHTVVVEDEDVPGMGVVFCFSNREEATFKEIVFQLEKAFLSGKLPEDYLL